MVKRPDCHTELRQCGRYTNISIAQQTGRKRSACKSSQKYEFDGERGGGGDKSFYLANGNKAVHKRI